MDADLDTLLIGLRLIRPTHRLPVPPGHAPACRFRQATHPTSAGSW